MPVVLTSQLHESSKGQSTLPLFDESGELTIAGNVIADFLEHADFSELFEHPAAQPFIITLVDEADESVEEEVLPGSVAIKLIDENDLFEMFLHYLDLLGETASQDDATLDSKTKLAVFENALLTPLDEKYRRGAFRQIRKQPGGGELVNRMLGAMIRKGEVKRAKKAGSGYKGGDYEKGPRYRTGATKAVKAKGKLVRRRTSAKIKQSQMRTRRARTRARALAASVGMEESFVFGFAEPFGGALFHIGTRPVDTVSFTEAEFEAIRKDVAPCYEMMKGKMKDGAMSYDDAEDGDDDAEESVSATRGVLTEAQLPGAVGSPSLTEGADIAGRVLALSQPPRKTLDESKKS